MPNTRKLLRRQGTLRRLHEQLNSGVKPVYNEETSEWNKQILSEEDKLRITEEIRLLDYYLNGGKKARPQASSGDIVEEKEKVRYFIDISSVSHGYVRRSVRKKNKGKSTKKLKAQKSVTFIRSVVARPGDILAYKEGRMGLSPKNHIFKIRREEISSI